MDIFELLAEDILDDQVEEVSQSSEEIDFDLTSAFTKHNGYYRFVYRFEKVMVLYTFLMRLSLYITPDNYLQHVKDVKVMYQGNIRYYMRESNIRYMSSFITHKKLTGHYVFEITNLTNQLCNVIYRLMR